MTEILSYFPGQHVTVFLETVDGYNVRSNSPTPPVVTRVIFPGFTLASGYPLLMTQLDVGLYYSTFTLPTGSTAVGNYLVDVSFTNPANGMVNNKTYQLIVTAPFGNFGTTTG
jgi:hypothetical protein